LFGLIQDVAEHVHEARDRDVQLALRGDGGPAPMSGDEPRLRTAFDAIFRAILREKARPAVVVAERRRDVIAGQPTAVMIVTDDGEVQEAYARRRKPFDEKRVGLGLALPLARRTFEGHGGRVSSPDGNGDPVSRGSAIITIPLTE